MSGTLVQAPKRSTSHRAAAVPPGFSDHLTHIPRAPRGTTPNILRAAAAAISVLSLIAAVLVSGFAADARSKISGVGSTDAPSVLATEDFVFQLQDMDAQLLNALLANGDPKVRVPRAASVGLYNQDRKRADGDLEAATAALAGDPDALARLHAVADTFGEYQAQAVRTLADDERDGGDVAGKAPATVIADYLAGHGILFGGDGRGGLMKAAQDLEQTGAAAIGDSSSGAKDSLGVVIASIVLFGVALLGALAALQVFVVRRFHRVLNPALAAATVAVLVFTIGGTAAAGIAAKQFDVAKSDAFDSVIALTQAKARGSGANADESRWLLVHDQAGFQAGFEQSYLEGSKAVAQTTAGSANVTDYDRSFESVTDTVGQKQSSAESNPYRTDDQFLTADDLSLAGLDPNSALGREFRNVTFYGEADLAFNAFFYYTVYVKRDLELRQMPLTTDDDLRSAVDFDTDVTRPETTDAAFTVYNQALDKVIDLNQAHFDSSMPAARDGVGVWTWLPYLLAGFIIGLTVLGVRVRLNEYR